MFRLLAAWGPGLLVMLADTDAGNVVTAAAAGARWGYRMLGLLLALVPVLYMVQELPVRLGIHTGRGYGELVRAHFGRGWAWLATAALAVAAAGSLATEFTGIAGVGELYGLPRALTLPLAAGLLLAVVATGSYRRAERALLAIGVFELAFFAVAWRAHPNLAAMARDAVRLPLHDRGFRYLAAAIIGATFNPWMVFYQQSAIVDKQVGPEGLRPARWDTACGAVLTQCLTASVLVAAAATLAGRGDPNLTSVGQIGDALAHALGPTIGRAVFAAGVLGAATVAAIVTSLALAWGIGEITGHRHALERHPFEAPWFYGIYTVFVAGTAALVWAVPDLVGLNVAAQVVNALLLPLVVVLLVVLAATVPPTPVRLSGWYLWLVAAAMAAVSAIAVYGGLSVVL